FWMIPDPTAITRENIEAFFHVSQEQLVPLISFSPAHLGLGAAAVLEIDRNDMGRQAGEMGLAILKGTAPEALPLAHPRRVTVRTNNAVMRRLGISSNIIERLSSEPKI
ncbi:MAG TPA: ABC transporter substrate binding protein, partial [Geobacteraceae bacterium]